MQRSRSWRRRWYSLPRLRGLPIASFPEPLRSLELLDGGARDASEAAVHKEEDAVAVLEVLAPSLVLVLLRSPFGRSVASFPEPLRSLELLDGGAMVRRKQPSTRRRMRQ